MTTAKHIALTVAITLFALLASLQAQTPRMATVNITPDSDKVHVSAIGDVYEMRIDVADESGEVVFQSGQLTGQTLDWNMKDSQGERVAPGAYLVTVTYRNAVGKVKKRVEQVTVEESENADTKAVPTTAPNAVQATITGTGTANKIAKFTGAATIGNSVITERAGKLGIGTVAPAQSLHVLSASSRLRLQSSGAGSLTASEYATNNREWLTGAGGSTAGGGLANKFFLFDQTANQSRLAIDTAGHVGIGTTTPAFKLHVVDSSNAGLRVQTNAQGGDLASFGGNGNFRIDAVNIPGGRLSVRDNGNVGIGTDIPVAKLDVRGDIRLGPSGQYRATGGEENLRIVRGTVSSNGTIIAGTGFTVEKGAEGRYSIVFNTPFAGTPSVTITGTYSSSIVAYSGTTDGVTASSFNAVMNYVFDAHTSDNTFVGVSNKTFHFIAIGPR